MISYEEWEKTQDFSPVSPEAKFAEDAWNYVMANIQPQANHVAVVAEPLDGNRAVVQWMFNPVPEGELLAWQEQPDLPQRPLSQDELRYQWLRKQHWDNSQMFVVFGGKQSVLLGTQCPSDMLLDLYIDGLMTKEKS